MMKRATEETIKAYRKRWDQVQELINLLRKKDDADEVLIEDLHNLADRYKAEGFEAIPSE